ncbi:4-methyl-5(B-hydroxyethyl)-thiazole monophosphate biosynthesis protein [Spirochaetia bacterium]|nr:4-methyl-5(B-hydroxyethyl)-thiazole monophosphate biosynthesis protein [Spirochaetia bacterium]
MAKKVLILLAGGFEEVEAVTPIDYLRRAGIEVNTVAVGASKTVTGAHGLPVLADFTLGELAPAASDGILLPGGMPGASNLAASGETGALLRELAGAGKLVAAICASPAVVLAPLGLLQNRRFTCYPGMEAQVKDAHWSEENVVIDGNLITSRGAGTAGPWAVAIIGKLLGEAQGEKVARSVLL